MLNPLKKEGGEKIILSCNWRSVRGSLMHWYSVLTLWLAVPDKTTSVSCPRTYILMYKTIKQMGKSADQIFFGPVMTKQFHQVH
jgi:hypothetical protein